MGSEKNKKSYDFSKDYKALPIKKRVTLILIAKNLLKQQQENNALLAENIEKPAVNNMYTQKRI